MTCSATLGQPLTLTAASSHPYSSPEYIQRRRLTNRSIAFASWIRARRNNGSGYFNISTDTYFKMSQMRLSDCTNDGYIDMIGLLPLSVSAYVNDHDGTFTKATTVAYGEFVHFQEAMRLPNMKQTSAVTFTNNAGKIRVNWPFPTPASGAVTFRVAGVGGVMPINLTEGTTYYIRGRVSGVGFGISLTAGGAAIDFIVGGTAPIEGAVPLQYPICRKVDMGGTIGEVVFITFGEHYNSSSQATPHE